MEKNNKTVLFTGAAGFIDSSISIKLLENRYKVVGVDYLNNSYDKKLKTSLLTLIDEKQKEKNVYWKW